MKRTPHWKTVQRWKTSGQALILIVITFFGLLLFLGLMVDLGQIFLAKGYLRRAADAASLAAAAQFRENRGIIEMQNAAYEAANMNGIAPGIVDVQTCDTTGKTDPVLCAKSNGNMPRKLVRVTIVLDYPMTFLSLLDIYTVQLTEVSISEAASMDVVLVIDTSESMSWEGSAAAPGDPDQRDPSVCNAAADYADQCKPFRDVKAAALSFTSEILNHSDPTLEEDRIAIVTFATGWQDGELGTRVVPMGTNGWTNDYDVAADHINGPVNGLKVYDPGPGMSFNQVGDPALRLAVSPVRLYAPDNSWQGFECLRVDFPDPPYVSSPDPSAISACGTTNIGGGMRMAANQFAVDKRQEALWVVIVLTDGAANATFATNEDAGNPGDPDAFVLPPPGPDPYTLVDHFPLGFCPDGDWVGKDTETGRSYCQDNMVRTRHAIGSSMYDADDFARDQANFVACPAAISTPHTKCFPTKGQGAVIFSIGLGDEILYLDQDPATPTPYGGALLRYLAAVGDDGNPNTDQCDTQPDYSKSCGNYFYAAHGTDLEKIFEAIYSRIFTRLTQ
jgi:Flp pilus assembly protein TadG